MQARKEQELRKELGLESGDDHSKSHLLAGGGMRVYEPTASLGTAMVDNCAVAFRG